MSGGGLGDFKSMRDMFDGAGPGASGADFKGGPFSEILNKLGVEPLGSQRQQQARPTQPQASTRGYTPQPVTTSPLPPQTPQMPQDPRAQNMKPAFVANDGARSPQMAQGPNYGPPSASSGGYDRLSDQELVALARRAGII